MIKTCKEYFVTDDLKVILEESENNDDCSLLKIIHTPAPRAMNGEIIFAPAILPELIKALTNAALDAYLRDNYLAGHADGVATIKPLALKSMSKYYNTEEGKKALKKEREKHDKKEIDNIYKLR